MYRVDILYRPDTYRIETLDVKTLCLGALTFGEASGYDIKKFFECTFSHFFVAGYGSIYPALADLTERGLVTCRPEPQEGKPDRKVYKLTDKGHRLFLDELERTPPNHKVRSEFLVQMFFAHQLPRERVAALFDKRLADIDESLQQIEAFERENADGEFPAPPGALFCAGFGKAVLTAARQFILEHRDEVIASGTGVTESESVRKER